MLSPRQKYMGMNLVRQREFFSLDQASGVRLIEWSNEHGSRPESMIGCSNLKEHFPYRLQLCILARSRQAKRLLRQPSHLSRNSYKHSMAMHWQPKWRGMNS